MTENSSPLVPKSLSNNPTFSSWNFEDLVLKKNLSQNIYFDQEKQITNEKNFSNQRSTKRLDSSDLISRCKQFLPLLTDANENLFSKMKSGENVRIELDEDEDQERTIEMNLMFCPNIDSSSSSDSDNDDEQIKLQIHKKINPVNIVEIQSEENINS